MDDLPTRRSQTFPCFPGEKYKCLPNRWEVGPVCTIVTNARDFLKKIIFRLTIYCFFTDPMQVQTSLVPYLHACRFDLNSKWEKFETGIRNSKWLIVSIVTLIIF